MKRIGYWAFRILVAIFSLIPFFLIYLFSDFLAILFYRLIRYRKKMIISNLKTTFPEKSDKEIKKICKDFYKNLSDIFLEAIKGFSLSAEEITRRYQISPDKKLDAYFEKNQSVIATTAHLGNWEWGAYSTGINMKHQILGVYKKVSQPFINQYLIQSRSKFNVLLKEMKEVSPYLEEAKPTKALLVTLIADQRPADPYKAFWTNFLNRDTAFFYGAEKFAVQYNLPVLFLNITRVKRGFYRVDIKWINENPKEIEKGDIIKAYAKILEIEVLKRPEEWLWSHSRWKHPKPADFIQN